MATSLRGSTSTVQGSDELVDLSGTIQGSSDELFDFCCQPCSNDNLNVEATGFCQQCQEYMCDKCCKIHRKFTSSKSHTISDKAEMPTTLVTPRVMDTLTETCPKHAGKVLEYFCIEHGEICCNVCLNLDHSLCTKKTYVPDISDGTTESREYKDLVEQLDDLVAIAMKEQAQIELNDKHNEECSSQALANIKQYRTEMDKALDRIVDRTGQRVTRLHDENKIKITSADRTCQSVLSEIEAIRTGLEEKEKASQNNQLFVDIKLLRHRIPALEDDIQGITNRTLSHPQFDLDEKVEGIRPTLSAMWILSVQKEKWGNRTSEEATREADDKLHPAKDACSDSKSTYLLSADLPPGWSIGRAPKSNEIFYINHEERKTQREHPSFEAVPSPSLPPGWERRFNVSNNRYYYINHKEHLTQWNSPVEKAVQQKSKTDTTKLKDEQGKKNVKMSKVNKISKPAKK